MTRKSKAKENRGMEAAQTNSASGRAAKPNFGRDAISTAIAIHWQIYPGWVSNRSEYLRGLLRKPLQDSGLKSLSQFIDCYRIENCISTRGDLAKQILEMQYLFYWLRTSLDGSAGYENLDEFFKKVRRIRKISGELAQLTSEAELFYLAGTKLIDWDGISDLTDGLGETHSTVETIYGRLMTRVCLDATYLTEAFSGIEQRAKRKRGQSPKVAFRWLIAAGANLFEQMTGQPVSFGAPKTVEGFESYAHNKFLHFMLELAGLFDPQDHSRRVSNTGFASTISRVVTYHRKNPHVVKAIFPGNDLDELMYATNALSKLK